MGALRQTAFCLLAAPSLALGEAPPPNAIDLLEVREIIGPYPTRNSRTVGAFPTQQMLFIGSGLGDENIRVKLYLPARQTEVAATVVRQSETDLLIGIPEGLRGQSACVTFRDARHPYRGGVGERRFWGSLYPRLDGVSWNFRAAPGGEVEFWLLIPHAKFQVRLGGREVKIIRSDAFAPSKRYGTCRFLVPKDMPPGIHPLEVTCAEGTSLPLMLPVFGPGLVPDRHVPQIRAVVPPEKAIALDQFQEGELWVRPCMLIGVGFRDTPGELTIGNVPAEILRKPDGKPSWSDTKIEFRPTTWTRSGPLVVRNTLGHTSDPVDFVVKQPPDILPKLKRVTFALQFEADAMAQPPEAAAKANPTLIRVALDSAKVEWDRTSFTTSRKQPVEFDGLPGVVEFTLTGTVGEDGARLHRLRYREEFKASKTFDPAQDPGVKAKSWARESSLDIKLHGVPIDTGSYEFDAEGLLPDLILRGSRSQTLVSGKGQATTSAFTLGGQSRERADGAAFSIKFRSIDEQDAGDLPSPTFWCGGWAME